MTCETFIDRLYDNDTRAAARGVGQVPPDVAAHVLGCDTCRAAYEAARADDLLLTRALLDEPSPAWRAHVLQQIAGSPHASWSQRIATANEAVTWGILAVAASQILLSESSIVACIAAFWAGGTMALLRSSMVQHWHVLRHAVGWA